MRDRTKVVALVCGFAVVALLLVMDSSAAPNVMPIHRMQRWASSFGTDQLFVDLEHIAVERVPDTEQHGEVLDWITSSLEASGLWHVERDTFESSTPFGKKKFTNIIATRNPNAARRLIVAAHLDSKYFEPPIKYVAATDSATCCAMLLDLARTLGSSLPVDGDTTLQLVFFDGEEAFVSWTAQDSLYGARHLAERWEKEGKLENIELFVLLDLMGGPNAAFYSLFDDTEHHVERLRAIEAQLRRARGMAKKGSSSTSASLFKQKGAMHHFRGIEDDHIPFLRRGVPIVHLISLPFPSVWHTDADTVANVDRDVFTDLNKIMRVFVAEYFALPPPPKQPVEA